MKLTLSSSDFCDLVVLFLYDMVTHKDKTVPVHLNQDWAEFLEVLTRKGMRSPLLQYYLSVQPQMRIRYNLLKDAFYPKPQGNGYIEIRPQEIPKKPEKTGLIKKTGKYLKKIISLGLLKEDENQDLH